MSLTESVPILFPDDWPRVRRNDPTTSHEAADSNNFPRSHRLVLNVLYTAGRPLAQFEVERAAAVGMEWLSPSRIRSAFSELEALGKVERTEDFRTTPSGRRAQVWRVLA